MKLSKGYNVILRRGRQITIPIEVYEALNLDEGDRLELTVEDGVINLRSRTQLALEALAELRRELAEAGITEEELQESGRKIREELVKEKYGIA